MDISLEPNPITLAIEIVGLRPLVTACGLKSYQAIKKWEKFGMPRTEWTGETEYSNIISRLTNRKVTKSRLLKWSEEQRAA